MPLGEPTTSTTSTSPPRGRPRPCPIITGHRQDLVDLTGGTVVDMAADLPTADHRTAMDTVGGHQGVRVGRHKGFRGRRGGESSARWADAVAGGSPRQRHAGLGKCLRDDGRFCNVVVGSKLEAKASQEQASTGVMLDARGSMRDTGEGNSIVYEIGLGFARLRHGRSSGHLRYLKSCHIKHFLSLCLYDLKHSHG